MLLLILCLVTKSLEASKTESQDLVLPHDDNQESVPSPDDDRAKGKDEGKDEGKAEGKDERKDGGKDGRKDEKKDLPSVPSIESTFEALKKVISIPGEVSSSSSSGRDPSLEVFETLRTHFEQIRKAIDHLDPQKTLDAAATSSPGEGNDSRGSNSSSSMTDWLQSITSLTESVPVIHQAIQLISNQIKIIRDRISGSAILTRSFPASSEGGRDEKLHSWVSAFDQVAKQFHEIQTAWHELLSKGEPLSSSLSSSDPLPQLQYFLEESKSEPVLGVSVGGGETISRQEDIYLPPRLQSILTSIDEARQRLRENIRNSLRRGIAATNRIILPGRPEEGREDPPPKHFNDEPNPGRTTVTASVVQPEVKKPYEYDLNTAIVETVAQVQNSVRYLADLYGKVLANYFIFLAQSRVEQVADTSKTGTERGDQYEKPVAPNPFPGQNGDPYQSLNFLAFLNREVDAVVDLVTRLSRLTPIELPG